MNPASLLARVVGRHPAGPSRTRARRRRWPASGGTVRPRFFSPLQQVAPAVRVLPEPVHDGQNVLLAVFVGADNHQHTLTIAVQARREVDPVRPDVDVALALEIALAPGLVLLPPRCLQPRDGRGRQALGIRPQKRRQRLAEVARRDALQVEPGQQLLDRLRLAQIRRHQDAERNLILLRRHAGRDPARAAPVTGTGPNPGHHLALRQKAVTHQRWRPSRPACAAQRSSAEPPLPESPLLDQLARPILDDLGQRIRRKFRWHSNSLTTVVLAMVAYPFLV